MKIPFFTILSLFIIAEVATAQSSGYSNVSNGESSKANKTETSLTDSAKLSDSLKQIALTAEIDALRKQLKAQSDANQAQIDQLKAKSESNQAQIDQLKVDNARTKIAGTVNRPTDNTLVIGQLKARSDSNQVEIDHLKAELTKAKETEAAVAQLKIKSESNQAQIDQLKVDNARTKIAGTVNRPTDNTLVIGQLKAQADTNQAQIGQLKRELTKEKDTETAIENSRRAKDSILHHFLISETDALLTQVKTKSDTNQVQFERLKAELENTKTAKGTPKSNKDNDAVIAQLKAKSDSSQAQIDQLKTELVKLKNIEVKTPSNTEQDALMAALKTQSDNNQAQIDMLVETITKIKDEKPKSTDSKITEAPGKITPTKDYGELIEKLKTQSESNQAQIDQLKVDNAKTKISGTLTSPDTDNTLVIAQLKLKSDSSQAQIDRLKTELVKLKNIELKAPPTAENGELIAQLKTQSDNNQSQIEMLVETITKAKEEKPKAIDSKKTDTLVRIPPAKDYDQVIAQLKTQSENNQAQIEMLVETITKAKEEKPKAIDSKKADTLVRIPPAKDYDQVIAQLKTQSENNQAQIDMLVETITKVREEKPKSAVSSKAVADNKEVSGVQLAEKSNTNVEIEKVDPEVEKTKKIEASPLVPVVSESVVPSSKNNGFVDEKGELASNGFYIVIGTFGSKENAERFKATNILKGHRNTKIIQNKNTKMYNIFALKTNNKKDADLERAKYKGEYSNVWILNLE
ncbi:MAG: SPOR domain-containing protein [Bacteroidota bacterium]